MSNLVFAIGVENYSSHGLKRVPFAEKDAKDFLDAFALLGGADDQFHSLMTDAATKTTMEYTLRRLLDSAEEDDTVIIFYAGHGLFAHGRNYLTCVDSQIDDVARTCFATEDMFEYIKACRSTRIAMFFDACHSGVEIADNIRDTLDHLSEEQLTVFFRDADFRVGFASCRADEKSYSSTVLKNGVWTHFLVQALAGKAPDTLDEKNRLRSTSLQDYLSRNVPQRVRRENGAGVSQHPQMFGRASSTFVVADISKIIESRKIELGVENLKDFSLTGVEQQSVKSLSGWKRHYTVPKDTESYSQSFFARISRPDLENKSERLYQALREGMGYKIDAINRHIDPPGASISTDEFVLDLNFSLAEDNPAEYQIQYDLHNVANAEVLQNEQFNAILDDLFDTLTLNLKERQDIRELVRRLETDKRLKISTPSSLAQCTVWHPSVDAKFIILPDAIKIEFPEFGSPKQLLESFQRTLKALPSSGLKSLMG